MNRAIFLDRDGTINVDKNYLYKIEDFEFLPGVIEGLRSIKAAGFLIVIITNQSGISRGYFTEKELKILNEWMIQRLKKETITIDGIYYCPHHPEASVIKYRKVCECRKPGIGLFKRAIEELDIDIDRSYAIGDKIRDCTISESTGCKSFLVGHNEQEHIISDVKNGLYPNVEWMENLFSAAKQIIEENKK